MSIAAIVFASLIGLVIAASIVPIAFFIAGSIAGLIDSSK